MLVGATRYVAKLFWSALLMILVVLRRPLVPAHALTARTGQTRITTGNRTNATCMAAAGTDETFDDVVIGAGISGLFVATELAKKGRSVLVVEARDRVGGRLLTATDGTGGDLGAAWFWPGEKRVASLAKQLGVPTFKQHVAGVALVDTGTARPQSYGDWEDQAGDSFRFEGGAQILALRLAERLPPFAELRLGMAVASVSLEPGAAPDAGAITVTAVPTGSEAAAPAVSFRCTGAVVVALPPALCAATVAFEPALPAPLAELARRTPSWFARMAKTLIRYESPFWRKRGLAGVGFSRAGPLSEIHDHSGPGGSPAMLFGFSQGPQEPDRAAVVAQLVRLFGPEAAEPLSVVTHSWSKERFTFGPDGGSGVGPEGRGDMHSTYGHPAFGQGAWGGRVLFTSTETGGSSPGHIEGALDAAERTVGAVLSGVAAAAKAK